MKRLIVLIGVMALLFSGCAGTLPSICDDLDSPSRLCSLSDKMGVRIEDIGNGLIIANSIAIAEGLYTTEDALAVMKGLRAILDNPVSYLVFTKQVYKYIDKFPGLLQIAESYFDSFGGLSIIMYEADQDMLKSFLDKQIESLGG